MNGEKVGRYEEYTGSKCDFIQHLENRADVIEIYESASNVGGIGLIFSREIANNNQ